MTTTTATDTANLVKCGKAHGYHASVADVRRCYNGEDVRTFQVVKTEAEQATGNQIRYAADLLRNAITTSGHRGLQTQKPVEAYGKREISDLITLLKRNDRITPAIMHNFGLAFSDQDLDAYRRTPARDGASLAPSQPANHTDPRARQQYFDSQSLEDGFYVLNGVVYKVVVAVHGSGRKYARRLDSDGKWVRTPGLSQLRPEHKMTLKEALATAKRHGLNVQSKLYGHCFVCGRTLTDDESIENGIGPVCAGKFS